MAVVLRLLDLFSGIGGFSYAAERLVGGYRTVQFVEKEPYCQQVLRRHWPEVPIHGDITSYSPPMGAADVVCGGFPCQDISTAGKGAGIKEGTRSGLFYELMRVVRLVGPRFVVLENVSAITVNGLDVVLGSLAEAGFDAEWACIRASDMGGCHRRDRWWLVAYANEFNRKGRRAEGFSIKSAPSQASGVSWSAKGIPSLSANWRAFVSQPVIYRGDDGLSGWLDPSIGQYPFEYRRQRIQALGNAVVPQVAAIPLARVIELSQQ